MKGKDNKMYKVSGNRWVKVTSRFSSPRGMFGGKSWNGLSLSSHMFFGYTFSDTQTKLSVSLYIEMRKIHDLKIFYKGKEIKLDYQNEIGNRELNLDLEKLYQKVDENTLRLFAFRFEDFNIHFFDKFNTTEKKYMNYLNMVISQFDDRTLN